MQMRPNFGKEERDAIYKYMSEDVFLTEFKQTENFENELAHFLGAKHCIATNNGTISLSLAAMALDLQPSDEVIVPNYTMIATPNSVKMLGCKPVFVDVEPATLCLDLEQTKKAVTPRTKAIYFMAANGRYPSYDIDQLLVFAYEKNIAVIEDAAQAIGSYYPDGTHIGLKGSIGSLSFSAPKLISTGQGGVVFTNDDDLSAKLRRLKDFGRSSGGNDIHASIGYNFKFTDLQAIIGLEQLKKLQSRIQRKKAIYALYYNQLKDINGIELFNHDLSKTTPWFIDCVCQNRNELIQHLKSNAIGSRTMYPPINQQVAYNIPGEFPISEMIGENGLWLPSAIDLTDEDITRVTSAIKDFYG